MWNVNLSLADLLYFASVYFPAHVTPFITQFNIDLDIKLLSIFTEPKSQNVL